LEFKIIVMYKLNRIEGTDIFFLSKNRDIKMPGKTIAEGNFNNILAVAEELKKEAQFTGSGDLVYIKNPVNELSDITIENWYLLELEDRYQIVKTDGQNIYNLPTNIKSNTAHGSLENIFKKVIELEAAQ